VAEVVIAAGSRGDPGVNCSGLRSHSEEEEAAYCDGEDPVCSGGTKQGGSEGSL
jgi:hypothetical protein